MQLLEKAVLKNPVPGFAEYNEEEIWMNDLYTVFVTRKNPVPMFRDERGEPLTITWLSIKRNDKQANMDWRHLQWIKNQLVGNENEGCELFPAESRLVDGSNQFHLWVFEDPRFRFPFGFPERSVTEKMLVPGMVQRPFPEDRKPDDLEFYEKQRA